MNFKRVREIPIHTVRKHFAKISEHPLIVFVTFTFLNGILVFSGMPVGVPTVIIFVFLASLVVKLINHNVLMQYKACHDALTYLPNRTMFYETIKERIEDYPKGEIFVFLMDLNKFKQVNDTLGHHVGDKLLKMATTRIVRVLRGDDTVARLGGDEFGVVLSPKTTSESVVIAAKRIIDSFNEPFILDGVNVDVGISVGIASYPHDGASIGDVVKCADVAMYIAKNEGLGYFVYRKERDPNSKEHLSLPHELKNAITNGELFIVYQPKLCLKSNKVIGVEALMRWKHPLYGMIPPDRFIPIAESSDTIHDITIWLVRKVIDQQLEWKSQGVDISIAINVSANDLNNKDVLTTVTRDILESDVDPSKLILEVTETSILTDTENAIKHLVILRSLGVNLSVDDFGTGHASFLYLKHLPVGEIKIDRSFVKDMVEKPQDMAIVKSAIKVSKETGCSVVAEGVEDEKTKEALIELGCDVIQGYYLLPPSQPGLVVDWVADYNKGEA